MTTESHTKLATTPRAYLDWGGAATSCLCAVHCAVLPVMMAALPFSMFSLLEKPWFETTMLAGSVTLGTVSLGLGFRRHRSIRAVLMLLVGVGGFAFGRAAEQNGNDAAGRLAAASGGLVLAGAHLLNRRLDRTCPRCAANDINVTNRVDLNAQKQGSNDGRVLSPPSASHT